MEDTSSASLKQQQHLQLQLEGETSASTEQSTHPSRMQLVRYVERRPWNWVGLLGSLSQYCREEHFGQVHSDEEIEEVCTHSSSGGSTGNESSEDLVASDSVVASDQTVPEGAFPEDKPQEMPPIAEGPHTQQQQPCGSAESHGSSCGQESGNTSTQVFDTSQMSCSAPEVHSDGVPHSSAVGGESHSNEKSCSEEPCGSPDSHSSPVSTPEPISREPEATESDTDMQPLSKKQRLMDETTTCTSDKAIQFPSAEDTVSDGYLTVFQALPKECAREHPHIPNVPPCQAQDDQSDPSDSEDPPDSGGTMLIKALEVRSPLSDHTPPQTLPDEVHPAVCLELENQLVPEETCQEYYGDQSLYSDADKMTVDKTNLLVQPLGFMDVGVTPNSIQGTSFPSPSSHPSCFRQPRGGGNHGLVNFSKPRLRLGLSRKQKCRPLH